MTYISSPNSQSVRNRRLLAKIIERFERQCNFAKAVDESETLISRVINNRVFLPAQKQREWSEALECQVDEIFQSGDLHE